MPPAGGGRRPRRGNGRRQRAYEAFLILRAVGCGRKGIYQMIEELARHKVIELPPRSTLKDWCNGAVPKVRGTPLVKAICYGKAYGLVGGLMETHPEWGVPRIANEIKRELGIRIPRATIYLWIGGVPSRVSPH